MRKLFILFAALFAFVACTQNEVEEFSANRADAPETLTVGFEGGDTRVELNEALKTVWTECDEVSVYFYSDANQKWQYQGETGERLGTLRRVDASVATTQTDYVVVAYPYNTSYTLNRINANLIASLPAVQSYKDGSYGAEGNIMVAQSEFTQFSLKSVCGWLRVELTGEGEVVESVKVRGNNGEQVAGLIYVDTATAEAILASEMGEASDEEEVGGIGGGLEFDDTIFREVTLDCGSGVMLGAEATAFYIALLPQTFENGMTIDIDYANAEPQTLVCDSNITIRRNHIAPMNSEVKSVPNPPATELWYTATAKVEPYDTSDFNVTITSNEWDETTGEGIITFNDELMTIGVDAFNGCRSLTSVTIPDSVTTIGDYAFSDCTSLTSVTIGDSVTTIGDQVFYLCHSLTSVTIPDSVTTIGESAFGDCSNLAEFKGKFAADEGHCLIIDGVLNAFAIGCGAAEYTIPDSVTTIGDDAFMNCRSLTSVTISDGVTTIGEEAFCSCDSLTSVTIGDSVTTIGNFAFYDCESLSSVYCEATTPPTLGDSTVFDYNASGRKIYVTAESVKAYRAAENWSEYAADIVGYNFETGEVVVINNKLFYTATAKVEPYDASAFNVTITSNEWNETTGEGIITFNDELTTIGDLAFRSCTSLTSVTILDSVTAIGDEAFDGCESLTSVTIPDSVTTIGEYAFRDCDSLTSVTIPDSVTTIGDYAFYECDSLTSVTIGDSVTTIGDLAFYKCYSLTSVTIPDSVTTIGNEAFYQCQSLTSVTIGDSVTTIGEGVFSSCSKLTSVTIPDSVTTIGIDAFYYCRSLSSVYCEAATPPTLGDSNVFDTNASGRKIYVPAKSVWAYKLAENWREYADYIVGYDFETGEVVE